MAFLTLELLRKVKAIIAKYHAAVIHRVIGASALTPEELEIVKRAGLVDPSLQIVKNSYLYGHALAREPTKERAEMSPAAFEALRERTPITLSEPEQRAVIYAEERAAETIRGLGNRVAAETGQVLIEADQRLRAETEGMIREKTAEAIATRKTARQLKLDLGNASKDWARDWDRIAVTEQHTAQQQGLADSYRDQHGDDEWVFKRPRPNACTWCKDLHLGPDGAPRIFRLSTLYANGATNAGRKRAEWKAVVGATHPLCGCVLGRVPAGWGFNAKGTLVPGGEFGIREDDDAEPIERSLTRPRERFVIRIPARGEPLFKGTGYPPGTHRTWKDGVTYEKHGDGKWRPVSDPSHAGVHDHHAEGAEVRLGDERYTVAEHHGEHDALTLRHQGTGDELTARISSLEARGLRSVHEPEAAPEPPKPAPAPAPKAEPQAEESDRERLTRYARQIMDRERAGKSWKAASDALIRAHERLIAWEVKVGSERLNRRVAAAELDAIEKEFHESIPPPQSVTVAGCEVERLSSAIEQHAAEILHEGLEWKRHALAEYGSREIKQTFSKLYGLHKDGKRIGTGRRFMLHEEGRDESDETWRKQTDGVRKQLEDAHKLPEEHSKLFEHNGVRIRMLLHPAFDDSLYSAGGQATRDARTGAPLVLIGFWGMFGDREDWEEGLTVTHELGHITEHLVSTTYQTDSDAGISVRRMLRDTVGSERWRGAQVQPSRDDTDRSERSHAWARNDAEFLAEAYRYAYRDGGPMLTTLQHTDIDLERFKASLDAAIKDALGKPPMFQPAQSKAPEPAPEASPKAPKPAKPPAHPHAVGHATKAARALEAGLRQDIGSIDPGAGDGLLRYLAEVEGGLNRHDLGAIKRALRKDPATGIREAIVAVLRRTEAETWDQVADHPLFQHLTAFPGLEGLAHAPVISRAVEAHDYAEATERYAYEHEGETIEPVPEEVPEDLPPEDEDPDRHIDERPIVEGEHLSADAFDFDFAKGLASELGAATSPAGDRAVHTGSSGLNVKLEIRPPERKRFAGEDGGYSPDYTDLERWVSSQGGEDFNFGTRRTREDYEILDEAFRVVRPMVPPAERFEAAEEIASHAAENRETFETRQKHRAEGYRSDAPTVKQKRKRKRKALAALIPPNGVES